MLFKRRNSFNLDACFRGIGLKVHKISKGLQKLMLAYLCVENTLKSFRMDPLNQSKIRASSLHNFTLLVVFRHSRLKAIKFY